MIKKNIPYLVITMGIFILFKFGYTVAETEDLLFLVSPTNTLIEFLTGSRSVFIQEIGYFHQHLNIAIDKSCSGFNYWLLCFLMISFLTLKYVKNRFNKILVIAVCLASSYVLTILVNSSRIYATIIIQRQKISFIRNSVMHESIGILTNLTFLILIYLILEKILKKYYANAKFA